MRNDEAVSKDLIGHDTHVVDKDGVVHKPVIHLGLVVLTLCDARMLDETWPERQWSQDDVQTGTKFTCALCLGDPLA